MIDRETLAAEVHTRLTWLVDHPFAHAAIHDAGETLRAWWRRRTRR